MAERTDHLDVVPGGCAVKRHLLLFARSVAVVAVLAAVGVVLAATIGVP